jgi:leucine dehydrogenase
METLPHEKVVVTRGERSGLTIIIAVHSTALGMAAGGCRMWRYPSWRDGLDDALRLSEAMTLKSSLAGLSLGGGKTVIALPLGHELTAEARRDVMLDLGDVVDSLGGVYGVAEDVGTTAEDMLVVAERTKYAYCLPVSQGGSGEPSQPTAIGVYEAIKTTCTHLYGDASVAGRRAVIIGLGQVGSRLARFLTADGAQLVVADIDPTKRALADELGATWVTPDEAPATPCDLLVPAALGGLLTHETVQQLQCRAVVGPANNQLASDDVADALAAREILWAPDFLVNAGGVVFGSLVDVAGLPEADALDRVRHIGATLHEVYDKATAAGVTPAAAAREIALARVASARIGRQALAT